MYNLKAIRLSAQHDIAIAIESASTILSSRTTTRELGVAFDHHDIADENTIFAAILLAEENASNS